MAIKADINKTINPIHQCEAPKVEKSSKYQLGLSGLAIAGLVVAVVGALGIFGIGLAASIALNVCILAAGGIITTVALAILCKSKKTDTPSSTLTASSTATISKKEESSTQKIPLKASTESKKQEHSSQTASTTQVKEEKKKERITSSTTSAEKKDKEPKTDKQQTEVPSPETASVTKPQSVMDATTSAAQSKEESKTREASSEKRDKEPEPSTEKQTQNSTPDTAPVTKPQSKEGTKIPSTQLKEEKKKDDPLAKLTVSELWEHINKSTVSVSQFGPKELNHRFYNVPCNKPAIHIDGRHIHANKVGDGHTTKAIVASQAPLREDLEHFWRAIYNTGYAVIDLTTSQDIKDRKAEAYYPTEVNKTLDIGSLKVTFIKKDPQTGIQEYQITDTKTNESKPALRYHCSDWIDLTAVSLPKLEGLVAILNGPLKDIPVWIHCAAGIGRTGTLIAAYIIHEKIQRGEITKENFKSSLADIILGIRKHRYGLVQRDKQFELLYNYGESLLAKLS